MMRAVSDSGHRGRGSRRQRPGEALIVGGFTSQGGGPGGLDAYRAAKRREAVRAAAPLAVPVALGVTLGVILAVSSGPTKAHVTQGTSVTKSSSVSRAPGSGLTTRGATSPRP